MSIAAVKLFQETKLSLLQKRNQKLNWSDERRRQEDENLRKQYYDMLHSSNQTPLPDKMIQLRKLVIDHGLPKESSEESEHYATKCSLRGIIWKILLGALKLDGEQYCQLVELGPCSDDKKIRNDTFRTYKNNELFWSRVDESKLSRVLTVCSRTYSQNSTSPNSVNYVQGMNVLAAPFLYLMPEVDAYTAFMTLITRHCPRYIVSNLDGVHHGCSLVDRTLEILDPILHRHIIEKILRPEIFAFPYIITLLANMSPLPEVIRLWDAIFAFGIHFDILLVTCHLMLIREELLAEQQAFRIQKMIGQAPLDSELLIGCTLQMIKFIPASLFEELISHPVEKPRDISQVLSREYQLTARSVDDDDEKSVSSQGVTKAARRRPLSGRLSKRPSERVDATESHLSSMEPKTISSSTREENDRGMKRSSSNGRTKVRTRSRSRSRGRAKSRVEDATNPADIPIPRRVRVHSTSKIVTEKSLMSTAPSGLGHTSPPSSSSTAGARKHSQLESSNEGDLLHPVLSPPKGQVGNPKPKSPATQHLPWK